MAKATFTLDEVQAHRSKLYSQIDEDGVIDFIFQKIGTNPLKTFVEIGISPCVVSDNPRVGKLEGNTVALRLKGWVGWMMDAVKQDEQFGVIQTGLITPENVVKTLTGYGVPNGLDLFSIDIDSLEYYVLKEFLTVFKPRVVVSEYNCIYKDKRTVSRNVDWRWRDDLFGVSGVLLKNLMSEKNYTMVHTNRVNAFFVHNDELSDECRKHFADLQPEIYPLYRITSKPEDWLVL